MPLPPVESTGLVIASSVVPVSIDSGVVGAYILSAKFEGGGCGKPTVKTVDAVPATLNDAEM